MTEEDAPLHAGGAGELQHAPRPEIVDAAGRFQVGVAGRVGAVHEHPRPPQGLLVQHVRKVTSEEPDSLDREGIILRLARERPDVPARPPKALAEVPADEAGGAGHRNGGRERLRARHAPESVSSCSTIVPTRSAFAMRVSVSALAGR